MCRVLLEFGADPEAVDRDGNTPLVQVNLVFHPSEESPYLYYNCPNILLTEWTAELLILNKKHS